jgi:formate dehydrogenase subunit gamma
MAEYPAWNQASARSIITDLAHLEGATLPILHALQEEFGHVDAQVVPLIADPLNLSRAEVHGTISFYHDFRTAPPPGRVIKLCRAEASQALGCEALVEDLAHDHGIAVDDPSSAAGIAVETVYCLGNCALGPSALVDGELIGRVDSARLGELCTNVGVGV